MISAHLSRWMRVTLVAGLTIFVIGVALFVYRYITSPTTLSVAVGSIDGEAARLMTTVASRLTSTGAHIRLKIVNTSTPLGAAEAFSAGKIDLAIIRPDVGDLSAARTVLLLTHGVVMIAVPPGSAIESIDGLKDKTVGVVGGEVNQNLIEALTKVYDLSRAKVSFKNLALPDVQQAVQSKQVNALLVVIPLTEQYLSMVRNFFERKPKVKPGLIPIESAAAIANLAHAYESFDIPKGTLLGSPPVPDDDMTTLRVPYYLVANKKLRDGIVSELTKVIIETRRDLLGEFPLLAQIGAPSTDKDAFVPIHPGAAAYFEGTEENLLDKYGSALYYIPMLFGALASAAAAAWKFMESGTKEKVETAMDRLFALTDRIRCARSETDLASVDEDIDNILKGELARYSTGDFQAGDAAAVSLTAHRLEHLINYRRSTFASSPGELKSAETA